MLDLEALGDALEARGRVARIVLAEVRGSTPRGAGTEMRVWPGGADGTIGGGQLELQATNRALQMLEAGPETAVMRQALGPALNQCCGGGVTVVIEVYDSARYRAMCDGFAYQGIWARAVAADAPDAVPPALDRKLRAAEHGDMPVTTTLMQGWLAEPVWRARRRVCIYGAGHVGRALAQVLAPLPRFDVLLCDVRPDLMRDLPGSVRISDAIPPVQVLTDAPDDAAHLIMTPDHDYDLELCHALLTRRSFGWAGLIGSATKWARFRTRLAALGHPDAEIARITCPIGTPGLGKHPQAIAVGVAGALLNLPAPGTGATGDGFA